jgi:hypothetical protein
MKELNLSIKQLEFFRQVLWCSFLENQDQVSLICCLNW